MLIPCKAFIACLRLIQIFACVWHPFLGAPYCLQFITVRLGMMQSKQPLASFSIHPVGDLVVLAYSRLIVLLLCWVRGDMNFSKA